MNAKYATIAAICIAVIAFAVVWTYTKTTPPPVPEERLGTQLPAICGDCGYETTVSVEQLQSMDKDTDTGWAKCPKCSAYHFYHEMTCDACRAKIPLQVRLPIPKDIEGTEKELPWILQNQGYYECPKCHKNALPSEAGSPR